MTAKPKKPTGVKAKTKVKTNAKAKAKTKVKTKTAVKAKSSALGDDPLRWMKDVLHDNTGISEVTGPLAVNRSASEIKMENASTSSLPTAKADKTILTETDEDSGTHGDPKKNTSGLPADKENKLRSTLLSSEQQEQEDESPGRLEQNTELTAKSLVVDLGSKLIISTVKEVKSSLDEVFYAEGDVELDVSKVGEVDTAGIQLLFAFKLELARQKRNLFFSTIPEKLRGVAEIVSVSESLFETR